MKNTLDVNATYGISEVTRYPDMLNVQQHADMTWQSILNDGNYSISPTIRYWIQPQIPTFLNVPMPSGQAYVGAQAQVQPGGTKWFEEVFDPQLV